jgi:hypothetical protein
MPTSPSYNIVLTVKYNVTDTVNPTVIGGSGYTLAFDEIEIDGTKQQDIISAYTFSTTGEHTVKYKLDDESINPHALSGCPNIVSIDIPSGVKALRDGCFKNCTSLSAVTMSDSIISIENSAFKGCSSLLEMTLPNSVTKLGEGVFSGCTNLTTINIPSGVTSFTVNNLDGCYSLSSITVDNNNTVYDSRDNCNAIIKTSNNNLFKGCKNTIIPNTVKDIDNNAFYGCTGLTSIVIPDSVTHIGSNAFYGCSSLISIDIPNTITNIYGSTFYNCSSLTSVTIPDSVTNIGDNVFQNCSSLTSIVSDATTAPTIKSGTFRNVHTNGTLTVPSGSSGYDTWMQNANYYLGLYGWTKVEQQ